MSCGQTKEIHKIGDYRLAPSRLIRSHGRQFPFCELARCCLGIQKQLALLELCKRAQRAAISVILVHSSCLLFLTFFRAIGRTRKQDLEYQTQFFIGLRMYFVKQGIGRR